MYIGKFSMKINTHNDWDPLEEIIVGHANHSRVTLDISSRSFSYANYNLEDIKHMEGNYPQWVIDEANEDADNLAKTLESMGVKVHRPKIIDWNEEFSTPDWVSKGWYSW